ncbi:hypothetical protein ZIOFF_014844 [Zingiber officinale]|uniref:Uncharacterized protein n=1 Tax=Zingiber officinale TaxID=94328 RepID=A0A8J5HTP1_ZINOF|nr:hypothetical protein ZIOFF_014844 [Zingiber officinale]
MDLGSTKNSLDGGTIGGRELPYLSSVQNNEIEEILDGGLTEDAILAGYVLLSCSSDTTIKTWNSLSFAEEKMPSLCGNKAINDILIHYTQPHRHNLVLVKGHKKSSIYSLAMGDNGNVLVYGGTEKHVKGSAARVASSVTPAAYSSHIGKSSKASFLSSPRSHVDVDASSSSPHRCC